MARRKSDSPQKAAMREMMQGYLKENDISIKSGNDVNSIMRDMMSVLLEGALDEELNEELGYSKYDYRNKETDNSRNGHSRKTMRTSYGDMDIAIPRDRKGVYEPQLIPKYQNTVPQAIEAVYPKTEIQQCIIHQIRNTTNYVSYKDLKKLMADLKMVYAAPDEAAALEELESFGEKWNSKYPKIYKSWSERWATLSTYFKYPNEVRKLIYTTNAIEGFNRQLRKVTKSRTVFPSDDSLLKMLYLATMDITKKWTGRRRDWSQIRAQLEIYFEERLEKAEF